MTQSELTYLLDLCEQRKDNLIDEIKTCEEWQGNSEELHREKLKLTVIWAKLQAKQFNQ